MSAGGGGQAARLGDYLPDRPGDLAGYSPLERFLDWAAERGLELYPAQEEAVLEAMAGSHVIVTTPTGSGKSLIALGAHFAAACEGRRSWYTAPIKALVSEKFFDLVNELGPARVGMATGDATVNRDAPVMCATAEILANLALREGASGPADQVVMDEFHFYADPDRGWAWQVPLLELRRTQFVLMSATLGDTHRFETDLKERTGRDVAVVRSATRPVPLDYTYARTPLHETIEGLLDGGRAPIYVVHFTQKDAVARAQALTSTPVATREERDRIAEVVRDFRWSAGFGQSLARFVRAGIGVHHAGMLPRYRRLVERLAQQGLLKVVCGTDTLGVGINVPIRTVVLTGLAKYDGTTSRRLTAREFHQIAGRAGRAGYDTEGSVVVQAPEHDIENERALAKAGDDPKKRRKVVRSQPPRRFVPWTEDTFNRLRVAPPEPLSSSFKVTHTMLLSVLDRPGDGCVAMRSLLTDNHEARPAQRRHIRTAIAMYRSLLAAGALERLDRPDAAGRLIRVTTDLQADFALNQPLSPFVLDTVPRLERDSPDWTLDVLSIVEATLENPGPVLAAQLDRLRAETVARLKAEGVEYEQRMAVLETLTWPKPLGDELYELFDRYRVVHPWAADHNIKPKSVVRDMWERSMGFADYVALYGLARVEGLVLRYLSDAYRGLVQSIPEDLKTDGLVDLTEWLGELVRQVDSSLIDEWEALKRTGPEPAQVTEPAAPTAERDDTPPPVTANTRAFTVMVRNGAFRRVELLARRDYAGLAELDGTSGWDAARWAEAAGAYFAEHDSIGVGAEARSAGRFVIDKGARSWSVTQVIDDPAGWSEWALVLGVDLEASDARGEAVIRTEALTRR